MRAENRTMAWRLILAAASLGVAVLAACVGSDPLSSPASADGGAPADAQDGFSGPSVYGVFLSSEALPTDFAVTAPDGGVKAFADAICQRLAADAGLDRAVQYQANLVSERGDTAALSLLTQLRAIDAGGGRWCSVSPTTPAKLSCDAVGLVFDTADSLHTGPRNPVLTDERGQYAAAAIDGARTHFFRDLFCTRRSAVRLSPAKLRRLVDAARCRLGRGRRR